MAEKFFLVDGHSHLYRAFFAVKGLTSPEGEPTNAVFGFTAMMRKLIKDHAPDYLAVAFDMPAPTFRHEMFADYKATRKTPPAEFRMQIPMAQEVLEVLGIPMYMKEGYEADDIMGTAARLASERGLEVSLVTGDKDARQLVGPRVRILDTAKGLVITEETLREQDGVEPRQVVDVMALSGDSSDNVPGVPKVGPKTALSLIRKYGDLESVLAHAREIKQPRLRENLVKYAEQARLSKKLVTINAHMPIKINFDDCRVKPPDPERVAPVYQKLGFRRFLTEMALPATPEKSAYHLVNTSDRFDRFMGQLRKQKRFSLDLETTSPSPMAARIVGLSFAWKEREAWYLPVLAPPGEETLDRDAVLAELKPILSNDAIGKVGQNIKYDILVLQNHGVEVRGIVFDSMIAAYVLNAEQRRYSLDELAALFLNHRMTPISDLIGKGRKQITMDQVAVDRVCDYACADADIALRLANLLERELRGQKLWELFSSVELPLISVLAEMEHNGIKLDASVLKQMSGWLGKEIEALEKKIHKEAGEEFNVASPRQLSKILFDKLNLPVIRRTKTGASTNSEVLEQLAITHRLPGLVLEFRQLSKLKSTYVDALPQMVLPETGRIHTSLNQTATTTGRISSSDPNLQNIPIRTELGERIRRAFVASEPEYLLLAADYSQIELRIVAHISGDPALRKAFKDDADIHQFVASQIHGVKPEEVTPTMRRAAKSVNFGIIYGLTPYGLSRDLRIPVGQADTFIKEYFERYPGVRRFIDRTVEDARKNRYVATLCGRRRPLPGINDSDRSVRSFAERAAVNAVIQGTAADMMKLAMIRVHRRLRNEKLRTRMLLQIHDELLFELPREEKEQVTELVKEEMAGALKMDVPIKVNVAVGRNWSETK